MNTIIESDSSKRWDSGLWNSIPCAAPNGLRAHSATPGAFTGTAQVTDSFTWLDASGMMLPIHSSSANTAPVASIFIPLRTTPSLSSAVTRSVRWVAVGALVELGLARALGRQDGVGEV